MNSEIPERTAAEAVKFRGLNLDWTDMQQPIASFGKGNHKGRFSHEQVKSLEFMFESEARPESRMKHRMADELGLQPRQVAIWFQNKRARSKTKQIEHEYTKLKAEFETLASSYELMRREHQSLLVQLQKLKNLLGKGHQDTNENSGDGKSENEITTESNERPSQIYVPSSDDTSRNIESTVIMKDFAATNVEEQTESSGNWCKFESGFLNETSCTLPWWELWS